MKRKIIICLFIILVFLIGCSKKQTKSFEISKITDEEIQKYNEAIESINKRRNEFVNVVGEALNAPNLPIMCESVYFNSDNDLIIEVNGEWLILDKALRNDMIYALKEALRKNKILVNSSGYGQFFSTSGQPLEFFSTE